MGMHPVTVSVTATAAHVMKRRDGDINDLVRTHHDEDTNGAGNIQVPVTLVIIHANTHNAIIHGHSITAAIH